MANIKKAGVEFLVTIDLGADQTGETDSFTVKCRNNATSDVVDIVGGDGSATVSELTNSVGTYQFPITVTDAGDYTLLVSSTIDRFTDVVSAFVVANASIDDVKVIVDDLLVKMTNVETQVDLLDEDAMNGISDQVVAIQTTVDNIKLLIDDEDDSTVNSVMEFVTSLNDALKDGSTGLAALKGYTDDIENMLSGADTLSDGSDSPFAGKGLIEAFDAIGANATALSTQLTDTQTALNGAITSAKDDIIAGVDAVKTVVDANKAYLEDAGYGLSALKDLIDGISTSMSTHDADIKDILADSTNGLEAIHNTITNRFDTVDSSLSTIDGKLDNISAVTTASVLI